MRLGLLLIFPACLWLLASGKLLSGSYLSQETLRVEVNLVNVFVTVQDERGEFVTDLDRSDFRVYDDDELQDIRIFEKQDEVQSAIGMLLDTSGSMVDILPLMTQGVSQFTRALPRLDDFFVASFGTNVRLIQNYSESQRHLEDALKGLKPFGTSTMYDALLYGVDKLSGSEHERKALIVFTDGNDNGSAAGHGEVVRQAQRSAVLLYFVAIGSPVLVDSNTLDDLAGVSGGRVLYVPKRESTVPILEQIRVELAKQYYLGYYIARRPGFHRIRVGIPDANYKIRTKTGYIGG
jgi:Ca-activated chloride channel family protein